LCSAAHHERRHRVAAGDALTALRLSVSVVEF
jgi:hypothetical protein